MKKNYFAPEVEVLKYCARDILTASDDEVFVSAEELFGD